MVLQEPGKRSQLWRMTGAGMLCHEGSSPPQSKPAQPRPLDSSKVLDIAGLAAVSDNRFELCAAVVYLLSIHVRWRTGCILSFI